VQIYLRTRGWPRDLDYKFLGEAPAEFWWRHYRPVSDVERPTILVESDGTSWRAYLAGIWSERRDATDNQIQFNVALSGECLAAEDRDLGLAVITRSASDLAEQKGAGISGTPLDAMLPRQDVERMLTTEGEQTRAEAAAAVRAAYGSSLNGNGAAAATEGQGLTDAEDGRWLGGMGNVQARAGFAALTKRLLSGQPGRALVVNLPAEEEDIDRLPDMSGALAVLIARSGPRFEDEVTPLGKAEELPSGHQKGTRSTKPRPVLSPQIKVAILIGGAVLAAILIDWLIRQGGR
jgi:hypothetical protein